MDDALTIGEAESFVQNELEITVWRGRITVSVDNPWAGDTESGLGYTCRMDLSPEQARQVAAFLMAKADQIDAA